jgi:hypothetical protein
MEVGDTIPRKESVDSVRNMPSRTTPGAKVESNDKAIKLAIQQWI